MMQGDHPLSEREAKKRAVNERHLQARRVIEATQHKNDYSKP